MQLRYGDDGLDPVTMEGAEGVPMDFDRTLMKVGWSLGVDLPAC